MIGKRFRTGKVGMKVRFTMLCSGLLIGSVCLSGCLLETEGPGTSSRSEHNPSPAESEPQPAREGTIRQVAAADLIKSSPPRRASEYHQIQAGETLSLIATRYGTTVEQLIQVNGLGHADRLQTGQWLYLPGDSH